MAGSSLIDEEDLRTSQLAIKSIKLVYPETRIIYVTSTYNSDGYQELAKQHVNDVIIKTSEYKEAIIPQIIKKLTNVPSRIMEFYCNSSRITMEDYVTPQIGKTYEINSEYIKRADFFVRVFLILIFPCGSCLIRSIHSLKEMIMERRRFVLTIL